MASWENKVDAVIGRLSYVAWVQANHDKHGRRYKKHHPYHVPEEAQMLVECLGMHDRRAAEIRAKEIMMALRQAGLPID
jgi:hypothetical protein